MCCAGLETSLATTVLAISTRPGKPTPRIKYLNRKNHMELYFFKKKTSQLLDCKAHCDLKLIFITRICWCLLRTFFFLSANTVHHSITIFSLCSVSEYFLNLFKVLMSKLHEITLKGYLKGCPIPSGDG